MLSIHARFFLRHTLPAQQVLGLELSPGPAAKGLVSAEISAAVDANNKFALDVHEFVLEGNEDALKEFYKKERQSPVLGDEQFRHPLP